MNPLRILIATHLAPHSTPVQRAMAPMRTRVATSFGAEFPINKGAGHLFELEVTRPGQPAARFALRYDNEH